MGIGFSWDWFSTPQYFKKSSVFRKCKTRRETKIETVRLLCLLNKRLCMQSFTCLIFINELQNRRRGSHSNLKLVRIISKLLQAKTEMSVVTYFQSHEVVVDRVAHQHCVPRQQHPELRSNIPEGGRDWLQHRCGDTREPIRRQPMTSATEMCYNILTQGCCLSIIYKYNISMCVLGEVVEDSVLRFHQIVQHTLSIAIHQRNPGQLISLLC